MMSNSKVELQAAYVIHQRPYSNTSAIIEMFTRDHGRIGVMAKGVKNSRSRLRGVLQPYQPLVVSWQGKGELPLLTQAELTGPGFSFAGSQIYSALYMNELLMRIIHRHDPLPELFACYQQSLTLLPQGSEARVLRLFEKNLLKHIGYELILDRDAQSGELIDSGSFYVYELNHGLMRQEHGGRSSDAFSGRDLLAYANDDLQSPGSLDSAKRLTRRVLAPLLGPRPLQSRLLFRAYQEQARKAKSRDHSA